MASNPQPLLRGVRSGPGDTSAAGQHTPLSVLYVPAQARDRAVVRERLTRAGAVVTLAADVSDALQALSTKRFGLVVVDLASDRSGVATVRLIRAQFAGLPIVGVLDVSQPLVTAEALYAGANDLLPWPFDDRDVTAVLTAARDSMVVDPSPGRADIADRLILYSSAMRLVSASLKAAASRRTAVMICGERGSGRHLVARTLHERDHDYVNRPLVVVDCGMEGPEELERRLFGALPARTAEPAAAMACRVATASAVIAAQGGSLLLVNVADAPARVQARLAQILRDREVFSVDVQAMVPLDIRPIALEGPEVDGTVADGRLRRDLFERLAQVRIDVPPLRRRREDIPLLAAHLLRRACEAAGTGPMRFSRAALALLSSLPWRGNASELQDVVANAVGSARQPVIQIEDVLEHARFDAGPAESATPTATTLREARARFERECISATLLRHHGRVGEAAKALGIQRTNLYRKVRQLNVSRTLLAHRK